jgi:hypothetical protein
MYLKTKILKLTCRIYTYIRFNVVKLKLTILLDGYFELFYFSFTIFGNA